MQVLKIFSLYVEYYKNTGLQQWLQTKINILEYYRQSNKKVSSFKAIKIDYSNCKEKLPSCT